MFVIRPSAYIKLTLKNEQKLIDLLRDFETKVRQRIAAKALAAAAKPVVNEAKSRAPKRYGALRGSIASVIRKYPSGVVVAVIGPRRGWAGKQKRFAGKTGQKGQPIEPANYAHLVEYGVRPHAIGKGAKLDRVSRVRMHDGTEKVIVTKPGTHQQGKRHPGARKQPFMRPAFDAHKGNIPGVLARIIGEEVRKELGRGLN